ncbi:F-box/kelch-repeat protein At3g23880-like [Vicia villosa]|uniref:F-box/kelch-repeat protein At3g23880-like n=1 Tax=Vicia villosa TaxID=3911 RepID=UPI00273CC644|nr:F-box/kelch-repeat protein At3g23880-like [Vicia villosa]
MQLRKPIMFVPHELIILILLRSPVKSLIRFKSVCKLWFSLISHDSHFANSHFQLNSETQNHRILLISTSTHESLSIDCEASLHNDSASVSLNLDSIFPEDFTCYEINGSCRGFILLCGSLNIYLWNPSTGLHKQIPFSPFGSNLDAEYSFGFGYDESTDDYLVVSTYQHDYLEDPHFEYFSLKANTWKQVEAPHFPFANRYNLLHEPRGGSLYKGAIHWLAYCYDLCNNAIVAFDLIERKLSYMPLPHPLQCGVLWVYGEFLSLYTTDFRNHTVEIWVMKEYKVSSSWTMALVLSVDLIVCPKALFFPLCCTKSGDIIGVDEEDGMFKYDKIGQFLDLHSYPNYDLRCKVTVYIDSLLSLPGDGDNKQA